MSAGAVGSAGIGVVSAGVVGSAGRVLSVVMGPSVVGVVGVVGADAVGAVVGCAVGAAVGCAVVGDARPVRGRRASSPG
ncbi:hypothetical protein CXF48_08985 [Corynebacterium bovis]|uniref:Uncharacterized protein n=1 Tax=Corynebacterium bovis TaxID=36808 RepID=A0A426PX31_9CORY|nr:hypothetical protein CXF48_08985 [Corynebacterium bovis]